MERAASKTQLVNTAKCIKDLASSGSIVPGASGPFKYCELFTSDIPSSDKVVTRSCLRHTQNFHRRTLRSYVKKQLAHENRKNKISVATPLLQKENQGICEGSRKGQRSAGKQDNADGVSRVQYTSYGLCDHARELSTLAVSFQKCQKKYLEPYVKNEWQHNSQIVAQQTVLMPEKINEIHNMKEITVARLKVQPSLRSCTQGYPGLSVTVQRGISANRDPRIPQSDMCQSTLTHLPTEVCSEGMIYKIIPIKCDGKDVNSESYSKRKTNKLNKSEKLGKRISRHDNSVNIKIPSGCYSQSLEISECKKIKPDVLLVSPVNEGSKRVRLVLGSDVINADIPPSKNRRFS